MNQKELRQAFVDKIASSGIEVGDAKKLGFRAVPSAAKLHPGLDDRAALVLPYYDMDGTTMLQGSRDKPYFRVRYFGERVGFAGMTEGQRKYAQPPGTGVRAYFPSLLKGVEGVTSWHNVGENKDVAVMVTEGELKAACASLRGYPTIGLGGVNSYRSKKMGVSLLTELADFPWDGRLVYLVFDSDYRTNPQVCGALYDLALELTDVGAQPMLVSLPDVMDGDVKTGLDDFLVSHKIDAFEELIEDARPVTLSRALWAMNDRVILIRDPGLVVDQHTRQKMTTTTFKEAAFATERHVDWVLRADGTLTMKKTAASAAWLKWPLRYEAERLTYVPGAETLTDVGDGLVSYNTWLGWGVKPTATASDKDVQPFLDLVEYLFTDAEPGAVDWFLNWCAYPLQHPGVKMFTSVVLFGVRQGTGKSLLGYTLGRIYGPNFSEITANDLHSGFNEWAESRQFVLADDVLGSDQRRQADVLKKMITQKELRVNRKFLPSYIVPDCLNYLFTSNHSDAFFLENDDRRFFIHEIVLGPQDEEFYVEYDLWLAGGGAASLFRWLLDRKVGGFNPSAPAMRTAAKERMISDGRSDLGTWVASINEDPKSLQVAGQPFSGDLITAKELRVLYDPTDNTRVTANGVGREMRRQGFRQVNHGRPVRTTLGAHRYFAIRNAEKWLSATTTDLVEHLRKHSFSTDSSDTEKY